MRQAPNSDLYAVIVADLTGALDQLDGIDRKVVMMYCLMGYPEHKVAIYYSMTQQEVHRLLDKSMTVMINHLTKW